MPNNVATGLAIGLGLIVGGLYVQRVGGMDVQRNPLPAESLQNIPVGSCFENGQCWNGKYWAPKPQPLVKYPRIWTIDGTSIQIIELQGVCIYDDTNNHAIQVLSKKNLPEGTGCQ